jgi:hypothetical protein
MRIQKIKTEIPEQMTSSLRRKDRLSIFLFSLVFLSWPCAAFGQDSTSIPPTLENLDLSPSLQSPSYKSPAPNYANTVLFSNPFANRYIPVPKTLADTHATVQEQTAETCTSDNFHSKACKYHLRSALLESAELLAIEMAGYLKVDEASGTLTQLEYDIDHGVFWKMYVQTLENFRFNHFNDDDAWTTTWIGHPMSGSLVEFIWVQNDPKSRGVRFGRSWAYWRSRFLAMIPGSIYSAQWLVGPVSESSIGNQGCCGYWYNKDHVWTNGTGYVDFVVTPTAGLLWSVGEDWIDLHLFEKVRARTDNPLKLFAASFLVPTKSGANILRFKAPWYRDPEP